MRASTDSRIEPIAVGERRWREDDAETSFGPILELAWRAGQASAPATRRGCALGDAASIAVYRYGEGVMV